MEDHFQIAVAIIVCVLAGLFGIFSKRNSASSEKKLPKRDSHGRFTK